MSSSFNQQFDKPRFKIYNTRNFTYLQEISLSKMVEINKVTFEFKIISADFLNELVPIEVITVHSFIGIVSVFGMQILLYTNSYEKVGQILNHDIYTIKEANIICISHPSILKKEDLPKETKLYTQGILNLLSFGFYYSFTYDLSNSLQRSYVNEVNKSNFLNIKSSISFHDTAKKKYYWNYNLNHLFKQYKLDLFITIFINGFFIKRNIQKRMLSLSNEEILKYELILISRRSLNQAGTRFIKRGINSKGHVANYVETEQITITEKNIFSYVQLRGSAPVFFQQTNFGKTTVLYKPNEEQAKLAFYSHINECMEDSKYMLIVNLLDNKKEKEIEIINTLEEKYKILSNENKLSNVKYLYFNFHLECKNDNYQSIDTGFLSKIESILILFSHFNYDHYNKELISTQIGIVRTNCLDSLDRTNVVQTRISYEKLRQCIELIGFSIQIDNFFCSYNENDIVLQSFKDIWAINGDYISIEYAGSESCKSSITRFGKSEIFEKLKVSIDRFYAANFEDKFKQEMEDSRELF